MYEVGSLIVYGNTGVCRVESIGNRKNIDGDEQLQYALRPMYQSYDIYTPVENPKVFMRPIISKSEAMELIDSIPTIDVKAYGGGAVRDLVEHYETRIKSHSCRDLMELMMSIYRKRDEVHSRKKKLGSVDLRFMKRAEDLLFGELAAALDIPRDQVTDFISKRLEANA